MWGVQWESLAVHKGTDVVSFNMKSPPPVGGGLVIASGVGGQRAVEALYVSHLYQWCLVQYARPPPAGGGLSRCNRALQTLMCLAASFDVFNLV